MMGAITDPKHIERESMRIIRSQLKRTWSEDELLVVERLIHTSGDVNLEEFILIHPEAIKAGVQALRRGVKVITDVEMALTGISKIGLQAFGATAACYLNDPEVPEKATAWGLTRAMTAMRLHAHELAGSIVAVGNAPTALREVLRLAEDPAQRPALIIGVPVGFVGAAESKEELWEKQDIPSITIRGTRGGSPLAATTINALLMVATANEKLQKNKLYQPYSQTLSTKENVAQKFNQEQSKILIGEKQEWPQDKPLGRTLMFQGTSSNVGKSILTAAFCRIFYQEGLLTAPFKAQNMALNSFVTLDGGEIGRAQVVQAQACGREPDVRMNPVLLKPTGQASSQIVLLGKAQGTLSALRYHGEYQKLAWPVVKESLESLLAENDVVVIEGAGSPAEVNLKANDIVNMRVAKEIQAPVILIADIDRGGALASVVGTLELLEPEERSLVKGIILNKFRGEIKLLQPALDFLAKKTGIPVLGVVPYYTDFAIPEEDSVALESWVKKGTMVAKEAGKPKKSGFDEKLDIAVIRLPYISNFTDFDALRDEADVELRYADSPNNLGEPDLVILPGSKNTLADLLFLKKSGLAGKVTELWHKDTPIIGICGGYQMLGRMVLDPYHTESDLEKVSGLGILPMVTELQPEKHTVQSEGRILAKNHFLAKCLGEKVSGYEIHMGRSSVEGKEDFLFELNVKGNSYPDGLAKGSAWGTYLHGIFDNDGLRQVLLDFLWERRGQKRPVKNCLSQAAIREQALNQLAELVRQHVDMQTIRRFMGLKA